jgi:nucleotide-binding universal stress UspA family protein
MIKIEQIVVPTDFSKAALPAIGYALSLATDYGADLTVLHAIPTDVMKKRVLGDTITQETFMFTGGSTFWIPDHLIDGLVRDRQMDLYNFLYENFKPELLKAVKVTPLVRLGNVVEEIVATAKERNCDLIVMVSRGHSWLGHIFSSSLTSKVVQLAPCPVLSIQPSARVKTGRGERVPIRLMELANAA